MSEARATLYYYLNEESKIITHYTEQQSRVPESFVFCGMSELPIRGAAGYYTKNQSGYTIVNGDEEKPKVQEDAQAEVQDIL